MNPPSPTTAESALAPTAAETLLPPFDPEDIARHGANAHRVWRNASGHIEARCSLWWDATPPVPGQRLGILGHYAAATAAAGRGLLNEVCAELAAHDCTQAVGPMDGNTWRRYRLVTERGDEPPFLLEPDTPHEWCEHFASAGFTPLAHYRSTVTDNLELEDPKARHAEQVLSVLGITLRPLDPRNLDQELGEFHRITLASFQRGFLYQPLPEEVFRREFSQLFPYLRPELILVAMHRGQAVGYVFNVPDLLAARRGQPVDTVILKTLAVIPDRTYAGLGRWLTQETHRAARRLGYRRVIHALMQDGNPSTSLSARYARPFRRYALYHRALGNRSDVTEIAAPLAP